MEHVRAGAHTLRMDFRFHAGYSLLRRRYKSIFSDLPFWYFCPTGLKIQLLLLMHDIGKI